MKERYTHIGRSVAVGLAAIVMNVSCTFVSDKSTVSEYSQPLVLTQSQRATQIQSIQMYPKLSVTAPPEYFEQAKKNLEEILRFFIGDFGPPPLADIGEIRIKFDYKVLSNLEVRLPKDGSREVMLDPIFLNFHDYFIAHEYFHAFYQSDTMLDSCSITFLEGWATYAQYRYKNRNKTNQEIGDKLKADFGIQETTIKRIENGSNIRYHGRLHEEQKDYIAAALILFKKPHNQNVSSYRARLEGVNTKSCDIPN